MLIILISEKNQLHFIYSIWSFAVNTYKLLKCAVWYDRQILIFWIIYIDKQWKECHETSKNRLISKPEMSKYFKSNKKSIIPIPSLLHICIYYLWNTHFRLMNDQFEVFSEIGWSTLISWQVGGRERKRRKRGRNEWKRDRKWPENVRESG